VVGQVASGLLFKKIGHSKWQLVGCCIGMTAFLGGMAAVNANNRSLAISFTILAGFFVGALELITIIVSGLICQPGDIGLASGLMGSLKQVSGSIAASIYVSILSNRLGKTIPANVTPAVLSAGLPASDLVPLYRALAEGTTSALEAVPGMNADVLAAVGNAMKVANTQAFQTVYLVSIVFGGLAIIAALFSQSVDHLMTDYVARKIRGLDGRNDDLVHFDEKLEGLPTSIDNHGTKII